MVVHHYDQWWKLSDDDVDGLGLQSEFSKGNELHIVVLWLRWGWYY